MKKILVGFFILTWHLSPLLTQQKIDPEELSPKPKISINGIICSIGYAELTCQTKTCDSTVISAGDSIEFCTVEPFTQLIINGYWLEWNFPGSNIPLERDSAIMPTPICYYPKWATGGSYTIDIYYQGALSLSSCDSVPSHWATKVTVIPVGIDESSKESSISIFPNPSSGIFSVGCPMADDGRIEIYSVFGEKIFASVIGRQASVNLSSQPKGIYFAKIQTQSGTYVKTFVLE